MAGMLNMLRFAAWGVILLFTTITFGISANLVHLSQHSVLTFASFTLAVCLITYIVVIPLFVLNFIGSTALPSFVFLELIWTSVLGIFWLAAASNDSATFGAVDCGIVDFDPTFSSICHQYQAIQAFSWLNWLILWGWTGLVFVLAIIAMTRGNRQVWMSPVAETDFFSRNQVPPAKTYGGQPQAQYGGQPQAQYPPQQYAGAPAQNYGQQV